MSLPKCQACGSALKSITYQARSADEAHRTITTCPDCPIDMSKMPSKLPNLGNNIRFHRNKNSRRRTSSIVSTYVGEITSVEFNISQSASIAKMSRLGTRRYATRISHNGAYVACQELCVQGMVGRLMEEKSFSDVSMGCTVRTYDEHSINDTADRPAMESSGEYAIINIPGLKFCLITKGYRDVNNKTVLHVFTGSSGNMCISDIIYMVYSAGYSPTSLRSMLPTDMLKHAINLSSRAWDTSIDDVNGFLATHKVDGERMFIVCMGYTAFAIRRDTSMAVRFWFCLREDVASGLNDITIIDVEYTSTGDFVIIDILRTSNGKYADHNRTMEWVSNQVVFHSNLLNELGVYVREYWVIDTDNNINSDTNNIVDGIVAINPGDIAARKIKSTKSTELQVSPNGSSFLSADGTEVFLGLRPPEGSRTGEIFEVRFTVTANDRINVTDVFRRVDKIKANSNIVVNDIITSSVSTGRNDDSNERRRALLWCKSVSRYINKLVESIDTPKPIIIDVGSGDGQSLDSMDNTSPTYSRLLIEPDVDKCKRLCRRLGQRPPEPGVGHLRSKVRRLVMRTEQTVVCNSGFEDILEDEDLCDELFPSVRAIVGTFSLHYVIECMSEMKLNTSIPIYGCGYVYDNVGVGEYMTNSCGVSMKRLGKTECSVTWGGDRVYHEPFVTSGDYGTFSRVAIPENVCRDLSLASGEYTNICKHVRVFLP